MPCLPPPEALEQREAVRYYAGGGPSAPAWSTREGDAVALFEQPQIGELSVRFVPEVERG